MAPHPMSGPDPSNPLPTTTGALRVQPDDASFETDFADLAARFAATSGGGLSPELSAELALEIVLNEIVEQACLGTGATGAAIVLPRDGKMVCRASSGLTAPQLGAELDTASGLSGECIKSCRTQRCDDVLVDPRADIEASRRLGVRSVMVMPLQRGTELLGVFELFSSQAFAFGDRDEGTLEALADRILSNLDRAAHPPSPNIETTPASESISEHTQEEGIVSEAVDPIVRRGLVQRRYDLATWALAAAVLAGAVLLAVGIGRHLGMPAATPRTQRVASPPTTSAVQTRASTSSPAANASTPQPTTIKPKSDSGVPPGGLRVYENGKEVFRIPPGERQSAAAEPGMQRASTVEPENVVKVSPATAEGSLLHRVEPEYPEEARQQRVQGQVVLDVHIGVDGAVEDIQVLSGPAQLAAAAIEAVKQWRFKPRVVDNRPAAMQTRITMNFRLPQ
jgi:TonB family protein